MPRPDVVVVVAQDAAMQLHDEAALEDHGGRLDEHVAGERVGVGRGPVTPPRRRVRSLPLDDPLVDRLRAAAAGPADGLVERSLGVQPGPLAG